MELRRRNEACPICIIADLMFQGGRVNSPKMDAEASEQQLQVWRWYGHACGGGG